MCIFDQAERCVADPGRAIYPDKHVESELIYIQPRRVKLSRQTAKDRKRERGNKSQSNAVRIKLLKSKSK